ncbi:negative regulator of transcription subunit 4 [Paramyrothecium foliicola]|nr:negative regulator of transcription subunit 4 [Paramyrothecium foliicola]
MAPQDSFIEEEEDVCPLCIEEFDLSDRNFRPCPCGYQVCQFCFNNIKNNMNGLCPACRRPYDEKTIQWKVVTSEEVAEFRANITKNQKKRAQEQRQKEVQKREAEKENRKNLIGVRVVQKNLVYITGLAPTVREDELLKTLRKPEFFGQYGNIQKISISNRKSSDGQHQSLGIYVTFEKPEEATRCIQAVHGSHNGDRVLKAQHGTTKYCSAWLKNEKCSNPGCMFLHEQGDEEDSYTRQDLSSMNSIHTQRPLPSGGGPSRAASRQQVSHPTPPPSSQPMARTSSKEGSDNGMDASALPSSANWARNTQHSRRGSHATSGAASSPAISTSAPATTGTGEPELEPTEDSTDQDATVETPKDMELSDANEQPQTLLESSLKTLLLALQACTLPAFNSDNSEELSPPMFDIRGGEKRKAMREDEESRLDGDQDDQPETRDHSEGEVETGGSLALGGEPEERELAGENHGFDQHRPGTQPPIQRNTDGTFSPALSGSNFNANAANLVGRTMTPQQLFTLRGQSSFNDQMPPGISGQSSMFQGQGHNRQSSRFSFANDNPNTATNVKLAANPRIMAQQSSMMPNTFQTQGTNQYYGTSMPGPPPGLKSTGTPPNMFGQGFGGSGFGGAPKDSSNELLQSLIGRNRAANSQAHDAGKREYMISSFSNQYPPPSTSTPAPASSLLASLYGNQPGAFQDFGSKQKKKGKKHRHANTSSSGGSGLVDLADPSILQARMQQHQSQSNAGVGQGLFGGQSQDDELPSLDEASDSVDALVADEPSDIIPGLGIGSEARSSPSIPPGFSIPLGLSAPSVRSLTPTNSRLTPTASAAAIAPPPGLGSVPAPMTPEQTPRKPVTSQSEAKKNIKTLAAESGMAKSVALSRREQVKEISLQDEEFPALGSTRGTKEQPKTPAAVSVATPKASQITRKQAEKAAEKRLEKVSAEPDAGVSTIAASATSQKKIVVDTQVARAVASRAGETSSSTEKSAADSSFPPLPALSTASVSSSPAPRTAPKTLRVVATPKSEVPPPASPAPTVASLPHSVASRAVSAAQRPETPASEMVSDTASVVSASISTSRAGSPPPSKVGSSALRTTTKSQQRKQRKEVLKQETKLMAELAKPELEEHAPVIGRKKKQKKEKPAKVSAPQAPVTTGQAGPPKNEPAVPRPPVVESPKKKEIVETPFEKPAQQKKAGKGKGKEKTDEKEKEKEKETRDIQRPPTPERELAATADEPTISREKLQPGPTSVFAEIRKSLWTSTMDKLQLLRPVTNSSSRIEHAQNTAVAARATQCRDSACKCGEIQEDDLAALRAGRPVRKQFHVDGSRMLITPNGDCIRGLTQEEEDGFLDLQAAIAATSENPGAFVAPRHQPGSGAFSLIKGRAVPNGRPNIFPATAQPQSQDPIGKLQREDALSYINQYVLPRLNLGTTNIGFPKGAASTRDHAAASLNSLAPYFYGPDAAAGVGIYSAADGSRSLQDFSAASGAAAHGEEGGKGSVAGGSGTGGGMPLMSVEDAEGALAAARRETEKLEKGLNSVIKRNRRLLLGGGGSI